MTGADDRDPRIADLLERHTPTQTATPDWGRVTGRQRRRRALRPALAATGIATVIVLAGIMFLVAPSGSDGGGALRFGDRGETGIAFRIQVTPGPVSRLDTRSTTARVAAAISERARRSGFSVIAEPAPGGTIDGWVPVSRHAADLSDLFEMDAFAVFDLGSGVIVRSPDPEAVLDAAEDLGPPGPAALRYEVSPEEPDMLLGPLRATDLAGRRVRYVPEGYAVIRTESGDYALVRATPALASEDISSVAVDGADVVIRPTADGARRWAETPPSARAGLHLVAWSDTRFGATAIAPVDVGRSGPDRLLLDPDVFSTHIDGEFRGPGAQAATSIPAVVTIVSSAATGPAEPRRGTPARPTAQMLHFFASPSPRLRRETLLRVLALDAGGETVLWTALDADGTEYALITGTDGDTAVGSCDLTAEHPDIRVCGGDQSLYAFGRVTDRVERFDLPDAAVGNGWFIVRFPRSSPGPITFRALDSAGRQVGRVGDQDIP